MPCLCGDACCPSCGPAQGNSRCPICRGWLSEGCDHVDSETGDIKAEYKEAAEAVWLAERAADDAYAKQMAEWDKLEKEYESGN